MKPNVHLTIDRLVLHGFERVNRGRLHAAVVSELSRLLADGDLAHVRDAGPLNTAPIRAASNTSAAALGKQIARAIYGGMKP